MHPGLDALGPYIQLFNRAMDGQTVVRLRVFRVFWFEALGQELFGRWAAGDGDLGT